MITILAAAAALAAGLATAMVSAAVALLGRCLRQKSCKRSDGGGTTTLALVVLASAVEGTSAVLR